MHKNMIKIKLGDVLDGRSYLKSNMLNLEFTLNKEWMKIEAFEKELGSFKKNYIVDFYYNKKNGIEVQSKYDEYASTMMKIDSVTHDIEEFKQMLLELDKNLSSIKEVILLNKCALNIAKLKRSSAIKQNFNNYNFLLRSEILIDKKTTLEVLNYDKIDKMIDSSLSKLD